ncbi:MAG: hypothetical protein OEY18_05760 [Candidatus Aminicenantes bacterium]|nr:hypothetical protein [Candidatus Aminicenantes bacterium]MDH5384196.1 hypothetical protein [Candidatus Aminicenantes bacterium]
MFKQSLLILIVFTCLSCGPTILVPPEIDLIPYERVGLISFSLEDAKGELDKLATQRFLQEITYHQREVRIIELGTLDEVLEKVNKTTLDQETATAIGEHFGVTSFFYGEINVSDVKPQIDISALIRSMRIRASFSISMTARFLSTETGATLWTDSVYRKESIAYMSMGKDQIPYFDVRDQEEAYRELIERLIHELTRDFRPTKRRL